MNANAKLQAIADCVRAAGVVGVLAPMHLQRLRSPPIVERRRRLADRLPVAEPQAPAEPAQG